MRFHRVRSLAACPEIVAARRSGDDWEIHVIRYGRLAAAGVARPGDVPQAVARAVRATAETVLPPVGPLPAAGIEETERIAAWLEQPGSRLMELHRRLGVAAARDAGPPGPGVGAGAPSLSATRWECLPAGRSLLGERRAGHQSTASTDEAGPRP